MATSTGGGASVPAIEVVARHRVGSASSSIAFSGSEEEEKEEETSHIGSLVPSVEDLFHSQVSLKVFGEVIETL